MGVFACFFKVEIENLLIVAALDLKPPLNSGRTNDPWKKIVARLLIAILRYVECEQFNLFLIFQESVKKKMSSLNLPTIPRLPSKAKFWKKRSANISDYDPTFRVIYLGNVLTGWAKGKIIFSIL